jgi:hypothetical protein
VIIIAAAPTSTPDRVRDIRYNDLRVGQVGRVDDRTVQPIHSVVWHLRIRCSISLCTGHGRPAPGTTTALDAVSSKDCARSSTDRASDYGSEGWGFESLRARPAHRPLARATGAYFVVLGATLGATQAFQPPNSARLIDSAAARLSPSSRCPYTSLVIAMLACPSTSETTCSGVPWASISEAPECRSSCGCQ